MIRLTAALGPAQLKLAPATVTITIDDADGDAYQLTAGTLTADGRPHTLAFRVAGVQSQVIYPLRVTSIIVGYALPAARVAVRGDVPDPLGELGDRGRAVRLAVERHVRRADLARPGVRGAGQQLPDPLVPLVPAGRRWRVDDHVRQRMGIDLRRSACSACLARREGR